MRLVAPLPPPAIDVAAFAPDEQKKEKHPKKKKAAKETQPSADAPDDDEASQLSDDSYQPNGLRVDIDRDTTDHKFLGLESFIVERGLG